MGVCLGICSVLEFLEQGWSIKVTTNHTVPDRTLPVKACHACHAASNAPVGQGT